MISCLYASSIENMFKQNKLPTEKSKQCTNTSHITLVKKACDYMQAHISEKLFLDDIALSVGTNRNKLAVSFKNTLGIGVFEWLKEQRMSQAKLLLIN